MNNEVKIVISLENKQLQSAAISSTATIKDFSSAVETAKASVKGLTDTVVKTGSVSDLSKRLQDAKTQLYAAKEGSTEYENALKRVTAISGLFNESQEKIAERLKGEVIPAINAKTGSLSDLTRRVNEARNAVYSLLPGTKEYENALKRLQVLSNHVDAAQNKFAGRLNGSVNPATGQAAYAMMNLNRIVQDSNYGFIGIANNIQPAVQSLVSLTATSGGVKGAFKAIVSSLSGPTGLLTVIAIGVALWERYSLSTRSAASETKEMSKDTEELSTKVRLLAASYDDLSKAEDQYRKDIITNGITAQEALIKKLQKKLNAGGYQGASAWIPFSNEQMTQFRNGITEAQAKIDDYNKKLNEGNKYVNVNIDLLKGFTKAANEGGTEQLSKFAKNNKLTEYQIGNLLRQLKDYKEKISSVTGGLSGELDKGAREMAAKLGLQRDEVIKAIDVIDKYYQGFSGKSKNDKVKDDEFELYKAKYEMFELSYEDYRTFIEKRLKAAKKGNIEELEYYKKYAEELKGLNQLTGIKPVDFNFQSKDQEKVFNYMKAEFERRGLAWDAGAKAFSVKLALQVDAKKVPEYGPDTMKPVRETPKPKLEIEKKEFDEIVWKADVAKDSLVELGNAIADAMFGAKVSIGEVIAELGKLIAKAYMMKGIEWLIDMIFPAIGLVKAGEMIVASHAMGGIVGRPKQHARVSTKMFNNAPHYDTGGITSTFGRNGIAAILHPEEMILNKQQQQNLFNMIASGRYGQQATVLRPTFIFRNTIDSQQIVLDGIKNMESSFR